MDATVCLNPNITLSEETKDKLLDIFSLQGKTIDEGFTDLANNYVNNSSFIDSSINYNPNSKGYKSLLKAKKESDKLIKNHCKGVSYDEYIKTMNN